MFVFSTSEVRLVKYRYDELLAVILAFLVRPLVSESANLDTTFGYSKQGAEAVEIQLNAVSWKSPVNSSHYTCTTGHHCFGDGSAW